MNCSGRKQRLQDVQWLFQFPSEPYSILQSREASVKGIVRMADRTCPLDEALTHAVLDLSGRGYAVVNMGLDNNVGEFPADLARHFFEAIAVEGRFCLHIRVLSFSTLIKSLFKQIIAVSYFLAV